MITVILLVIVALLFPGSVYAQAPSINLAYDYATADEATIDVFVVQRKTASGNYADIAANVAKTARTYSDTTITVGTVYCYRVYAQKTTGTPPQVLRSAPSNEVCGTFLAGVVNLRIQ